MKLPKSATIMWNSKDYRRKMPRYRLAFVLLILITAGIVSIAIWNTVKLQNAIHSRTLIYVDDVSDQIADSVDLRLTEITIDLQTLSDSVSLTGLSRHAYLSSYLERKQSILGFSSLFLLLRDGTVFPQVDRDVDFFQLDGVQQSFEGSPGISFLSGQDLLYSVPVSVEGGASAVLAGIRSQQQMQKLIGTRCFEGKGFTCITDTAGSLIISPSGMDPFLKLEELFPTEDPDLLPNIRAMEENIAKGESDVFSFKSTDGNELILAYNPLQSYDWVLLTLVPADLISHQTTRYIARSFVSLGIVILLCIGTLLLLFFLFRQHFTHMQQIAFVDSLTGCINNTAFRLSCANLLQSSPPCTYTLVHLDLKNFKLVNEEFGSAQGDRTLRYVMETIQQNIKEGELATRSTADRYFLLLKESDPSVIRSRLSRIAEEINSPAERLREPYRLTIQSGAYLVDDPSLDVTILQDRAITACRSRSSDQDGVCIFYDTALTRKMQEEHDLNDQFEPSLKNGDFKIFFQPKIRTDDHLPGGIEALVRWDHPQRGLLLPQIFVPLFEKNGKVCTLDVYVFEEVCRTLRRWIDKGGKPIPVSINVSRQHFRNVDFLDPYETIARKYEIPKGLIELELTESIFFDANSLPNVDKQIKRMHELGFHCSLDDFGMGYSSLSLLMEFDIDAIKLDQSFFKDIDRPRAREVISSILQLSKSIGTQTVAEGVKNDRQITFLTEAGCDLIQSYYYSPPLPVAEFEEWLARRQSS